MARDALDDALAAAHAAAPRRPRATAEAVDALQRCAEECLASAAAAGLPLLPLYVAAVCRRAWLQHVTLPVVNAGPASSEVEELDAVWDGVLAGLEKRHGAVVVGRTMLCLLFEPFGVAASDIAAGACFPDGANSAPAGDGGARRRYAGGTGQAMAPARLDDADGRVCSAQAALAHDLAPILSQAVLPCCCTLVLDCASLRAAVERRYVSRSDRPAGDPHAHPPAQVAPRAAAVVAARRNGHAAGAARPAVHRKDAHAVANHHSQDSLGQDLRANAADGA